jgi:hypothetical protein
MISDKKQDNTKHLQSKFQKNIKESGGIKAQGRVSQCRKSAARKNNPSSKNRKYEDVNYR